MNQLSTRAKIEQVIEDMNQAGSLMTISGVAREVGVSNATIHNRYPDLAERIRELAGKVAQRNAKAELEKRRGKIKEITVRATLLRKTNAELKELLRKVDSVNAALVLENESLQAKNAELWKKYGEALKLNQEYLDKVDNLRGRQTGV